MYSTQDDFQIAKPIYDKCSVFIEQKQLAPTPLNYFLCYQYFKGGNEDFQKQIQPYMEGNLPLSARSAKQLYESHFAEENALPKFEAALKHLFQSIMEKLSHWGHNIDKSITTLESSTSGDKISDDLLDTIGLIKQSSRDVLEEIAQTKIEMARLQKELDAAKQEAFLDELTRVGNRKAFSNKAMQILQQQYQDTASHTALIITDVDHFKSFNDTYGHLIGDSVLRVFAKQIQDRCKQEEHCEVFRYGGEEFIILMKHTSLKSAEQFANVIREQIQLTKLRPKNSKEALKRITASFGISMLSHEDTLESWIQRADTALYFAKQSGRNQVVTQPEHSVMQ